MQKSVYRQIRKQNGEAFAREIRIYDNGIFDIPDIVEKVKFAGRDAKPLLAFLASFKNIQVQSVQEVQDPIELLEKAGYEAFFIEKLEDFKRLEPYFKEGEKICSFQDTFRLVDHYVIGAIKKNAWKIPRGNPPNREDEYGRSVITIQIWKGGGEIFITNRYNHGSDGQPVDNPDNTFFSNPDNIILGLGKALIHTFGVDFTSQETSIPENYIYQQDKIVAFHTLKEEVFFGTECYVKDNQVFPIDRDYQIIIEDCIIDLKEKKVFSPVKSRIAHLLQEEIQGKKLQVKRDKNKNQVLFADNQPIVLFSEGKIKEMNLRQVQTIAPYTIANLSTLEVFRAFNLTTIEEGNFINCFALRTLELPKARTMKNRCIKSLFKLQTLTISSLETVGDNCLIYLGIEEIKAPSLVKIGNFSLSANCQLRKLDIPVCEELGEKSGEYLPVLSELNAENWAVYRYLSLKNCRVQLLMGKKIEKIKKKKNQRPDAEKKQKVPSNLVQKKQNDR